MTTKKKTHENATDDRRDRMSEVFVAYQIHTLANLVLQQAHRGPAFAVPPVNPMRPESAFAGETGFGGTPPQPLLYWYP